MWLCYRLCFIIVPSPASHRELQTSTLPCETHFHSSPALEELPYTPYLPLMKSLTRHYPAESREHDQKNFQKKRNPSPSGVLTGSFFFYFLFLFFKGGRNMTIDGGRRIIILGVLISTLMMVLMVSGPIQSQRIILTTLPADTAGLPTHWRLPEKSGKQTRMRSSLDDSVPAGYDAGWSITPENNDFSPYSDVTVTKAYDTETMKALKVLGSAGTGSVPNGYSGPQWYPSDR